jgi:hypothetical protein
MNYKCVSASVSIFVEIWYLRELNIIKFCLGVGRHVPDINFKIMSEIHFNRSLNLNVNVNRNLKVNLNLNMLNDLIWWTSDGSQSELLWHSEGFDGQMTLFPTFLTLPVMPQLVIPALFANSISFAEFAIETEFGFWKAIQCHWLERPFNEWLVNTNSHQIVSEYVFIKRDIDGRSFGSSTPCRSVICIMSAVPRDLSLLPDVTKGRNYPDCPLATRLAGASGFTIRRRNSPWSLTLVNSMFLVLM